MGSDSPSWVEGLGLQISCLQHFCLRNKYATSPISPAVTDFHFLWAGTSGNIFYRLESPLQWVMAQDPIIRILLGMGPVTLAVWLSSIHPSSHPSIHLLVHLSEKGLPRAFCVPGNMLDLALFTSLCPIPGTASGMSERKKGGKEKGRAILEPVEPSP